MAAKEDSRSEDVQKALFGILLQLAFGVLATLSAWRLLSAGGDVTEGRLILMAGLAGAAGSSLAPLLRPVSNLESEKTTPLLSSIVYAAGGFGVAAALYVIARSLLFGSDALPKVNQTGVLAFGGLIGLIVGRRLAGLEFPGSEVTRRLTGLGERPALLSALGDLESRLSIKTGDNYDGFVLAAWYRAPSGRSVGTIRVQLHPRVGPDTEFQMPHAVSFPGEEHPPVPTVQQTGRILVQGGRDVKTRAFTVSITTDEFDTYPNRAQVLAPVNSASPAVEFRVLSRKVSEGDSPVSSE